MIKTISTIESLTGGLLAATLTNKPGASKFFKGSLVTYTNEIKEKFGIDTSNGVVNKQTAIAMAQVAKKTFDSDIAVSLTGEAGPEPMEKNVGDVWITIIDNNKEETYFNNFKGNRQEIRQQCVDFVIKKLSLT